MHGQGGTGEGQSQAREFGLAFLQLLQTTVQLCPSALLSPTLFVQPTLERLLLFNDRSSHVDDLVLSLVQLGSESRYLRVEIITLPSEFRRLHAGFANYEGGRGGEVEETFVSQSVIR